jgi:hypothetical protein
VHLIRKSKSPLKFKAIPYKQPEIDIQCWNCQKGKRALVSDDGGIYCKECGAMQSSLAEQDSMPQSD